MLKQRRDAYDGRGNFRVENSTDIPEGYSKFVGREIMLEKHVNFLCEISVIAARNTEGEIAAYPAVENIHEENILRMTIAPARINKQVSEKADQISKKVMNAFSGAGVFGIEMFVTEDEKVLVNEIAPRVHNSGHHTLQSSATSQFEQHLRAILGLKLGRTDLLHRTVMFNILGPNRLSGNCKSVNIPHNDHVFVKWYKKKEIKPMRKMGHFNVVDVNDDMDIQQLITKANKINDSITFNMN